MKKIIITEEQCKKYILNEDVFFDNLVNKHLYGNEVLREEREIK